MSFPKFPFKITIKNFENDIKPLITEIRPNWEIENLKTKQMYGGVSNVLIGVYFDDEFKEGETDMVLVRVYGNMLIDRNVEMINMNALSSHNIAARVWGQFANGCCYQFIHGTVLDEITVRKPDIYRLIIDEFVKLHTVRLDLGRPQSPWLFRKLRQMTDNLPEFINDADKNGKYLDQYPRKDRILMEIEELEKELTSLDCPVVFCHNDLLLRNMVLNINKDRIHMIDFEYADYNYCAFDIGNHFSEFAGLDNPDYSLYPDKSFQMSWLRQYLERLSVVTMKSGEVNGDEKRTSVSDSEVERWFRMTNKFALAAHLFWSLWAIWQEMNSSIAFNYFEYALLRWTEYLSRKNEFLAL